MVARRVCLLGPHCARSSTGIMGSKLCGAESTPGCCCSWLSLLDRLWLFRCRAVAAAHRGDGDEGFFTAHLRSVAQSLLASAAAASLLLTPAASAETQVLRFPVSEVGPI